MSNGLAVGHRRGRRVAAGVAAVGVALIGALTALPAAADSAPENPADPATPATVTADALPTVQIDGVVWSQVVVGRTVYAAGSFSSARPAGAAPGVNTVARHNLLAYDIETGALVPGFAPVLDGQALSVTASPDGTRVYVVGDFTKVDGEWRVRAAAFDTATGALVTSFRPTLSARAATVTATNTTVYIGGNFASAASQTGGTLQSRPHLAAFSAATGEVASFAPSPDAPVTALTVTADGAKVVVGGRFTTLAGQAAVGLGAVDPGTGAALAFPANQAIRNSGTGASITSLYADASGVYGSGYNYKGTGNLEGSFRAHPSTGELVWVADCHGDTYSAYPVGDAVYTASHAHYCGNMGGFPQTEPWTFYHGNAFSTAATGVNTPDIYGYRDHRGRPAPSLLTWYPQFTIGSATGQNQAGWSVAGNADYVVFGGEFPTVNGTRQQGLVRFARTDKAPNARGPVVTGAAANPNVVSVAEGEVRVAWRANHDQDNKTLTYRLYRRGTTAPIHEQKVTANFWQLPTLSFTDTGRTPGSVAEYRVSATDPFGNTATSGYVGVTVASAGTVGQYAREVLADGASSYWRLGESSGTAVWDWAGVENATAGSGVGRGAPGALTDDPASTFDGTEAGGVATREPQPAPDRFTVESWVRTTSTTGGKIVGFGTAQTGPSKSYDRHVYMGDDGRIHFGVYPGAVRTVSSTASYNDGEWHHVVASLGVDGMRLYVDGATVAQRSDVTGAQRLTGYWRIGGDRLSSSWTSSPTSAYLTGAIDDVSVYAGALSPERVLAHYTASGRTSSLPAMPDDAYGASVRTAGPDLYWRLGERSGTQATDTGLAGATGTMRNGVTLGVAGAVAGTADTAVRLDGVDDFVTADAPVVNPTTYSEELWFATTSTRGGRLIGFGNSRDALSTTFDRHVYLEGDGRLSFGTYTGQRNIITSTAPYNDGMWHHLVATQSSAGMRLYVDGRLVAQGSQTKAQSATGYWRVGGDRNWGPGTWFDGRIDEVAIYSTALSDQTVAEHYAAGTAASVPNAAPTAAFTATPDDLTVGVDGSGSSDSDGSIAAYAWDLGDGNRATGATARHTYAAAGTYTVTLTVTDDGGATAQVAKPVTVTAPAPANTAPTAAFTASTQALAVSVDGSGSADAEGAIASYAWDFGDGSRGSGRTAEHTYAAAGTYTVTLTVTDGAGATASATRTVTVSAPAETGDLARDAFERELATGWGTAEVGGAWTAAGTQSSYAVTGGAGVHAVPRAGATLATTLDGVASTAAEVAVTVSADKAQTGGGTYITVAGRRVGSSEYAGRVRLMADGVVTLTAMRDGTALAGLNVPGLTSAAGDRLNVRVQVTGTAPTTIRAKVWKQGTTEPAAWQVAATDTTAALQTAGSIGLKTYLSGSATNAPMTLRYDDLVVRAVR